MAKKEGGMSGLVTFIAWLVGVIVSLAVGEALINGTLAVSFIGTITNQIAGWIVVIVTLLGVLLAIVNKFK